MRKITILGLVLGLVTIISCTKDSSTFGQNDYRAFSVCIDENNIGGTVDSLIIGTVPNGKQWVVVSADDDLYITISRYGNSKINLKDEDLNQNIPFYIDEGNEVVLYGYYNGLYTSCISINEYNVD